jgi:hypothetical protein
MINNLCILFSLLMVVYVVVRAAVLDTRRPWFEKAPPADPLPDTAPTDPRRPIPQRH